MKKMKTNIHKVVENQKCLKANSLLIKKKSLECKHLMAYTLLCIVAEIVVTIELAYYLKMVMCKYNNYQKERNLN